jgi:nitric oxide reductase subunit B
LELRRRRDLRFLINLPIVSYYEIGTALTANHGHAAMMGVYGMLAVGLGMFALRYLIPEEKWPEKLARISFWSLNIGLAWMVFFTLLPLGVLQLYASVNEGYFEARSLGYLTTPGNRLLEWGRMPGDLIFIIGGILPFGWMAWLGLRYSRRGATTDELPQDVLFTESSRWLPAPAPPCRRARGAVYVHQRDLGLLLQRIPARCWVRLRPDGAEGFAAGAAVADRLLHLSP